MNVDSELLDVISQSSRFKIIAIMKENDGVTNSKVGNILDLSVPGVKKHMDTLIQNDLVKVNEDNVIHREHKEPYKTYYLTSEGEEIVNELTESPVFNRMYRRINQQLTDKNSLDKKDKSNSMLVKHANKYDGWDYRVDISENGLEIVTGSIGSGKSYSNRIKIKSFIEEYDKGHCFTIDPFKSYKHELKKYSGKEIEIGEDITVDNRLIGIDSNSLDLESDEEIVNKAKHTINQINTFSRETNEPVLVIIEEFHTMGSTDVLVDAIEDLSEEAFVIITTQAINDIPRKFITEDTLIQSFHSFQDIDDSIKDKLLSINNSFGSLKYLFAGQEELGFAECVISDIGRAKVVIDPNLQ